MSSHRWPLMEISRRVQDDPHAHRLLDDFFDACFASVPPPSWALLQGEPGSDSARLAGTLSALNAWLRSQDPENDGLLPPAGMLLEEWAEEIALQYLSNSPC